ncbi:YaeQ family protein [Comamonadaceae bacterium M7527]|nr:YaeQ family protein [Comamonadaceae bacterium M7527]
MAIKSTIFKANVQIADVDHGYYADHALTLARHPSENDERMMVRLVALALNAHQLKDTCNGDATLGFGAGLSDPEEPDVQLVDFTGRKRLWMEVGQPEDKPLSKACSKADSVLLYAFSSSADIWWNGIKNKLSRLDKLQVWRLPTEQSQALVSLAQRSMQLQATIQESTLTLSSDQGLVTIEPILWK